MTGRWERQRSSSRWIFIEEFFCSGCSWFETVTYLSQMTLKNKKDPYSDSCNSGLTSDLSSHQYGRTVGWFPWWQGYRMICWWFRPSGLFLQPIIVEQFYLWTWFISTIWFDAIKPSEHLGASHLRMWRFNLWCHILRNAHIGWTGYKVASIRASWWTGQEMGTGSRRGQGRRHTFLTGKKDISGKTQCQCGFYKLEH